jgi:hypothetical protein
MRDTDRVDLVAEMHHLLNVVAPRDPDLAAGRLYALIARYGRAEVGAALAIVAADELVDLRWCMRD